jgi:hypothetical protein
MQTPTEATCDGCVELIHPGQTHCSCGKPTPYASFEDRAAYEVSAWRLHLERDGQNA